MNIITDLDDCVIDTSHEIIKRLEKIYNRKFDWNYISEHNVEKCYNLDREIVRDCINKTLASPIVPIIEDSVSTILKLLEKNDVYILSHRPLYLYDHTRNMLNKIGLDKVLLILEYDDSKSEIAKSLDANIVIDDKAETLIDYYNKTDCVCFIMNKPWNQNLDEDWRMVRADSWKFICDCIGEMK